MPGTLYKLLNSEGEVIYVGSSMYGAARINQHSAKPWWPEVASINVEHFALREEAVEAENQTLDSGLPKYNKVGRKSAETERERERKRERRAAYAEELRRKREEFHEKHFRVEGLHCSNCDWDYGWVTKGRLISEAACPKCGCHSLVVEPGWRRKARAA